jgi:hypothetical protein
MPSQTPQELKKLLVSERFEVYRTVGDRVMLADRVRENLIMDSGVSVASADVGYVLRAVFRAQASDFQGESPEWLLEHARRAGEPASALGYAEVSTSVVPIHDPSDKSHVLDTWYEVTFECTVTESKELVGALKQALGWPKVATRTRP